MRSNYAALWILLSVALVIFLAISFADDLTIGDYTLKKGTFAEMLLKNDSLDMPLSPVDSTELAEPDKPVVIPTDSTTQSIFLFGDSMTFNLAIRLAAYAKQNGHIFHAVNWDSSNTITWAECDTLDNCISRYKPTQIFISLGSNELYIKKPESRLKYVRKIIEKIGDIPYVWIGPPNWKEDGGINDMLEDNLAPRSFFRSAGMSFKRKKDNIHPTREASALWIDSVMRWLPKSSHPFVADFPSDSLGKVNPNIVFLKAQNK